jgi:hypothetical protein
MFLFYNYYLKITCFVFVSRMSPELGVAWEKSEEFSTVTKRRSHFLAKRHFAEYQFVALRECLRFVLANAKWRDRRPETFRMEVAEVGLGGLLCSRQIT